MGIVRGRQTWKKTLTLLMLLTCLVLPSLLGRSRKNRCTRKMLNGRMRNGRTSVGSAPVSFVPMTSMNRGTNKMSLGITKALSMVVKTMPPFGHPRRVRVQFSTESNSRPFSAMKIVIMAEPKKKCEKSSWLNS